MADLTVAAARAEVAVASTCGELLQQTTARTPRLRTASPHSRRDQVNVRRVRGSLSNIRP
jgi:hypothetical protein